MVLLGLVITLQYQLGRSEQWEVTRLQIRNAVEADVQEIAQMWHLGWHQGHAAAVPAELVALRTPAEFVDRTRGHLAATSVAMREERMVGFFMVKGSELYQFYVDPELKGSGVAAELMGHAEAALAGQRANLACAVGNARAAAFYRKCGWEMVRTGPYVVETSEGPFTVQEWRFEKSL